MSPNNSRRVVITGVGVISPNGIGAGVFWDAILHGKSAARKVEGFDASRFPTTFACEVTGYVPTEHFSTKEIKRLDRFVQLALIAAKEAIADSGLTAEGADPSRIGVVIGSGIGGIQTLETEARALDLNAENPKVSAFLIPKLIVNMASGEVAIRHGFCGPNLSQVTACATGTHAIGDAMKIIQRGAADVMVAGGTEAAVTPLGFGGFCSMKALSRRNDDPTRASRPFDLDRDGFVMGEGAGIVVVEELTRAQKRGAKIYAEVAGYGLSADAYHITEPEPTGRGARQAMAMAIADAGLNPGDVDYVNAHGTSTRFNDKAETLAIKTLFGDHARKLAVSSTKSTTGHLLGAAGAVESVACAFAFQHNILPPTSNYVTPDPDCDLDIIPNQAREAKIRVALNNAFGFGGQNGCLILKRFQ
ncbi:beta-ketoacyl-ACP synthase II [bacterium]|nr:beta-ketoacyl-ACP synthase II [bacterium]